MYNNIFLISAQIVSIWSGIVSFVSLLVGLGTFWIIFSNRFVSKAEYEEMKANNTKSHGEIRAENDKYLEMIQKQADVDRKHYSEMLKSIQKSIDRLLPK